MVKGKTNVKYNKIIVISHNIIILTGNGDIHQLDNQENDKHERGIFKNHDGGYLLPQMTSVRNVCLI